VKQQEMCELFGIPERTLRDWKKSESRNRLYSFLEAMDYTAAKKLLSRSGENDLRQLLENEKYYVSERDFERDLYEALVSGRDSSVWLKLSRDTTLSKQGRARAAYLYSFLTRKPVKLSFQIPTRTQTGLYHGNRNQTGNGLAKMYGLLNGVDMRRFNQYRMTGAF